MLRRRAVDVTVVARLGEPFAVTFTCCDAPSLTATATVFYRRGRQDPRGRGVRSG